jgi:hypothetical protein
MLRAVCFRQSRPHSRHSGFGQTQSFVLISWYRSIRLLAGARAVLVCRFASFLLLWDLRNRLGSYLLRKPAGD